MAADWPKEEFVECQVRYVLETDDRLIVVENVPARVNVRTGERLFAPETVERLQHIAWDRKHPARIVETPVFEFSET